MPTEPSPTSSGPDDFDRQLRDLASGAAGEARFRELSAAERAKQAGSGRKRRPDFLRRAFTARRLRKPVSEPPRRRSASPRPARRRLRVVGGRGYASRPRPGRQRLVTVAKGAGILLGFVALLVILHLLGLGPQ